MATTKAKPKNETKPKTNAQQQRPDYIPSEDVEIPPGDVSIPQIGVVQAISPQLDETSDKFMENAKAGMIFHEGTGKLWPGDVGAVVIVLTVVKQWIEWVPRKQGGGLVAIHNSAEEANQNAQPGNEIRPTLNYFVMMEDESIAVVRLGTPSKQKVHRVWARMIDESKTISGMKYRIKSIRETNRAKQPYFNFLIEKAGWASKQLFESASKATKNLSQGQLPAPDREEVAM